MKTSSSSDSDPTPRTRALRADGAETAGAPVVLRDVGLRFVHYHDKQYSVKRAVLDLVLRRRDPRAVNAYWALREIDLRLDRGTRLGIIGANGAGKSSLLRVLAGIYPPTVGSVEVVGNVAPMIEMGAGFHPELTGRENVFFNGAMLGFTRSQMRPKVEEIFAFTGLEEFADLPLKYYSSGMAMKLAFAIATDVQPDVLLIDESLGVGDATFMDKARARVRDLLGRASVVAIVSHDMESLKELCTRGIWMKQGRIVADGPIEAVIQAYLANAQAPAQESGPQPPK